MYRVLIADDEVIERAVLYRTLQKNLGGQCEIFQAENGREALEIYHEKQIQIAILDIEMPGINGIQAAEKIREEDKNCCLIFLTAFDEFAYAKKAITVRALDYLLKPYNEQELLLVMDEAMRLAAERSEAVQPEAAQSETVQSEAAQSETVQSEAAQSETEQLEAVQSETTQRKAAQSENVQSEALQEDTEQPEDETGDVRLTRVMEILSDYIRENYMYELSMQDVARTMNYSETYFCKLFKQCFGQNFTAYLTEFRVSEAKKMLEQPMVNVKEIGRAVGYGDANYFAKVFKRITGQSPTEYRMAIFQKK